MKKIIFICVLFWILSFQNLFAHEVNYQVKEGKGVCVSFFFAGGEPMNYAEIEVYAPGEKIVFQKAMTDKNGIFCFMPDRDGIWQVLAKGETEHGLHGAKVEIKLNRNLSIEEFKKPLVARYTKIFIALGIAGWMVGIAGLYQMLKGFKISNR